MANKSSALGSRPNISKNLFDERIAYCYHPMKALRRKGPWFDQITDQA